MCVYLRFDLELCICVAEDRHGFVIRETYFTLSNGSESIIFLVHLLVHRTFCLDLPCFFNIACKR